MEKNKFSLNFFIKKFEAIKSEDWGSGKLQEKCVLWHCGMTDTIQYFHPTEEASALHKLITEKDTFVASDLYEINDLCGWTKYKKNTPKERILAALYEKRDGIQPSTIPIDSELQQKELILN